VSRNIVMKFWGDWLECCIDFCRFIRNWYYRWFHLSIPTPCSDGLRL